METRGVGAKVSADLWTQSTHTAQSSWKWEEKKLMHTQIQQTEIDCEWNKKKKEENIPSERLSPRRDEIHKTLNHEGLQVRQTSKAAGALRRDRKRKMADSGTRTESAAAEG